MLLVHLFVCFVCVSFCHFSPLGVGGWLRFVIVALPGLFYELLCYVVCKSKMFSDTSETVAKPRYAVIKMKAILKIHKNILCLIESLILGQFNN